MQRLRRIRQLGLSTLCIRVPIIQFEHSLGVMHLATTLTRADRLSVPAGKYELRVAALLHDIGHGPLSHVTESFITQYTRQKHEDILHLLRRVRSLKYWKNMTLIHYDPETYQRRDGSGKILSMRSMLTVWITW
jgi:HD superfamily phosphohydrolase